MKRLGNILRFFGAVVLSAFTSILIAAEPNDTSIKLRITDSATEIPISGAIISLRKSDSQLDKLGVSTNGNFSFSHPPTTQSVQLRVEAENYTTRAVSLSLTNSRIEQSVKLDRNIPFRGHVIAPTGQDASGAQIVLQQKQKRIAMIRSDPKIETYDQLPINRVSDDGSFSVGPDEDAESFLIVHDLGLAEISLLGWTNGTKIQLRAWTSAKGRMLINDVPAVNQTIIASRVVFRQGLWGVYLQKFSAQTDPAGFFSFDRLPPGDVTLQWQIPTGPQSFSYSHGMTFPIDPSLPNDVKYILQGRSIRGEAVTDADFDWKAQFVFAHLSPPREPLSEFTPMGISANGRHFGATLTEKGKFEATAIPPGKYTLRITAHKQDDATQSAEGTLIVPDGVGPIDLGQIKMTKRTD